MPVKLKVDYEGMKDAYVKGVPFNELAKQYNIKDTTLRAYASRNGWQEDAAKARQALQRSINSGLMEKGAKFAERISTILDKHVSALELKDPESLELEDWLTTVKILQGINTVGRENYGMDGENGKTVLNMAVNVAGPNAAPATLNGKIKVIDIEPTEPSIQDDNTPQLPDSK